MGNLKAKAKTYEEREIVPAGKYKAVVVGVCDIGTQQFKNGSERQIVVIWELHKRSKPALDSKGRIHTVSEFYSLKFGEYQGKKAKLRQMVEAMRGRAFTAVEAEDGIDVEELVEEACGMQIQHVPSKKDKDKPWAEIGSIFVLDEEDEKPEIVSDTFYFEISSPPQAAIPSEVPTWLHKIIEKSDEWVKVHGEPKDKKAKDANPLNGKASTGGGDSDDDDDIPF